jgi:glycosyltransferase involved in cell wall biosynthesis
MPKYSVCITTYNAMETLRKSLESILSQLDKSFEVVVVDNYSNDGTLDVLRDYERRGQIRLVLKKCCRGNGRQTAVDNSNGSYLIVNVDADEIYKPTLTTLLRAYHKNFEGYCLLMHGYAICPRVLIASIGGYRDLQYSEDFDFYARCAIVGKFKYLDFDTRTWYKPYGSGTFARRLVYKYQRARDLYRVGVNPANGMGWRRIIMNSPVLILGYLAHSFSRKYGDHALVAFNKWKFLVGLPPEIEQLK